MTSAGAAGPHPFVSEKSTDSGEDRIEPAKGDTDQLRISYCTAGTHPAEGLKLCKHPPCDISVDKKVTNPAAATVRNNAPVTMYAALFMRQTRSFGLLTWLQCRVDRTS
jgi:hypothetical protein